MLSLTHAVTRLPDMDDETDTMSLLTVEVELGHSKATRHRPSRAQAPTVTQMPGPEAVSVDEVRSPASL